MIKQLRNNVELAKKKKKNPRSEFLSKLMKSASGAQGEELVTAFFGRSTHDFLVAMQNVAQDLVKEMPNIEG